MHVSAWFNGRWRFPPRVNFHLQPGSAAMSLKATEDTLGQEIEQQARLVRGLMAALHAHTDADPDESLLRELTEAKKTLRELQQRRRDAERDEAEREQAGTRKRMGVMLGPETTGLRVETTI